MNTGIAALLTFGAIAVLAVGAVYVYTAITGDVTGEKLQPLARKGNPLYPIFGPGPSPDPLANNASSKNSTSAGGQGNYTLPNIKIPTSRNYNNQQQQPQ